MRKLLFFVGLVIGVLCIGLWLQSRDTNTVTPLGEGIPKAFFPKPLEKYTFQNLRKTEFKKSQITLGEQLKDEERFNQYIFYFTVDGKKVSGLANIPKNTKNAPILVMFRGFVDPEIYETGVGTIRSSEEFARNGFITLAPDFLGYGKSDDPSSVVIEERFQTYTTALSLLSSLTQLPLLLEKLPENTTSDSKNIGLWGHSNGGQIALSVLGITKKSYPTVLWAPVSKPFPYSILYFTDEFEDHGKALRKIVADFENDYDAEKYSPTNYYKDITAPMEIHQGTNDDAVPLRWSDQLTDTLQDLEKEVEYFTYQGDDHNFAKGNWQTVVDRNIDFYRKTLLQ